MFDRMSRRDRLILIILLIMGICALFYYFVYTPMQEKMDLLDKEIEEKEMEISIHMVTISKIPQLEERYAELEYIEYEKLPYRITSVDEMLQVLVDESSISGVKITFYKPEESEESTEVNMTAEGSYEGLILFLNGIEKLSGQVKFGNITVSRQSQDNDTLNINGNFIFSEDFIIGGDLL